MNQQHQWRDLFVTHRKAFIQQARPILFGHGAIEQLGKQQPRIHRGLTVKALWLPLPPTTTLVQIDDYLSMRIVTGECLSVNQRSTPIPVVRLAGWSAKTNRQIVIATSACSVLDALKLNDRDNAKAADDALAT